MSWMSLKRCSQHTAPVTAVTYTTELPHTVLEVSTQHEEETNKGTKPKNGKSRWDAQEERLQHEAPRGTATNGRRPGPPPHAFTNPHLCEKSCPNR